MQTSDFDYALPPKLIAQKPAEPRDNARLMVVQGHQDTIPFRHRRFSQIGDYLGPDDLLVANDTRVMAGRLWAQRPTGAGVELLLLRPLDGTWWEALARPARRLRPGTPLALLSAGQGSDSQARAGDSPAPLSSDSAGQVEVGERTSSGGIRVRFAAPLSTVLAQYGHTPLPPYIQRPLTDPEQYQTVYGQRDGSAAAPTAGLHFTPALMDQLRAKGVEFAFATLHIGPDTFRPIRTEYVDVHQMHAEYVELPAETADAINTARAAGRRIVAVGTTAVRVLETAALAAAGSGPPLAANPEDAIALAASVAAAGPGETEPTPDAPPRPQADPTAQSGPADPTTPTPPVRLQPGTGWTALYITPSHRFRVVDALITNFHLPRSTLLVLVSAFAGHDLVLAAYQEAIRLRYRFFSFGDAMLIL